VFGTLHHHHAHHFTTTERTPSLLSFLEKEKKKDIYEKGLTRTGQFPADQSTRRFPRAKSDRFHYQTLTYLVSPRHRESPPSEFHVSDGRRRGWRKDGYPAGSLSFSRSRSLFPPRIFWLSLDTRLPRALLSSLSFSSRCRFARLLHSRRPTPRTPFRGRRRGTNNARFNKRVSDSRNAPIHVYNADYSPLPAYAVSRDDPVFLHLQADAGDTHGRFVHETATRSARRAHTTPERVCNGDLWRETAEGPHGAPWITPPPGVRSVATRLELERWRPILSLSERRHTSLFPSLAKCTFSLVSRRSASICPFG